MSRRQRRTKGKRREHAARAGKGVRAATITGSLAATAAIGLASGAEAADAASFDATLVKEINPSVNDSSPGSLVNFGGALFFGADDGTNGPELWKSDGTEAGTQLFKDIRPGAGFGSGPSGLTVVGSTLFFTANDGPDDGTTHGSELWTSDGTAAGTQLVTDINPTSGSYPRNITEAGGTVFFTADDGTNGYELWKSDGSGAQLVEDINPTGSSYPFSLTEFGGALFFQATDGPDSGTATPPSGYELWTTEDPFTDATLVKDINPSGDGNPSSLVDFGGTLFFRANDGTTGSELWSSDGTGPNTLLFKDINPSGSGGPGNFVGLGGTLFFSANDGTTGSELWKSDGSEPGTQLVKDINPGGNPSFPEGFTEAGGTTFFRADDGNTGIELWSTDGTGPGTALVRDINPLGDSPPNYPTELGGSLFFSADDGLAHGTELWKAFAVPPPAGPATPAPAVLAPTFNLKAAIRKCKKKFPKGPKRKKCIKKAKAKAGAA